jgi:hypothetical protein
MCELAVMDLGGTAGRYGIEAALFKSLFAVCKKFIPTHAYEYMSAEELWLVGAT